jgi:HlyD family secretion protein
VTEVGKVADVSSGVASYPVTVAFDASGSDFTIGTTVTGAVAVETRENVLQVPTRAITPINGVSTVRLAKDGTADGAVEVRTVETGLTADGQTEITSGLKAGDKVLVTVLTFNGVSGPGGASNGNGSRTGTGTQGFQPGEFRRLGEGTP